MTKWIFKLMGSMVVFNSIIVFDLETTSMPHLDHNTTKITELAFIGCEIKHLKYSADIPRALHKLVLLFNPNKLIHPGSTVVSGLNNEILENVKPFRREDADMLRHFISRLPPPVCMIAHNGQKFDFPILRRALDKLNTVLGDDVYCIDSITAFRAIYPKNKCTNNLPINPKLTPPKQKTIPVNSLHYKEKTDVKRELFPDNDELEIWVSSQDVLSHPSSPKSYKLQDLYKFLHGREFENAHRAEVDAIALLRCIIRCEEFLNWIENYSVIFDTVTPLF